MVIVIAEGAGQELVSESIQSMHKQDASATNFFKMYIIMLNAFNMPLIYVYMLIAQSCGVFQLRKSSGVMFIWKVELLKPRNGVGSLLPWKVELLPIWRRQRKLAMAQ
ncbi:unnamed protein product [Sphenostylis stenocarpa]|uniref:Uncharacterized protein n=1 Tax=Sphenostylis stenocarpa TaxID=92480 RepID=A0AA86SU36_9FABA|nr:unnamed protein product [Sphenostylis stenocarpa]